jgi:Ca-activated chloride channel family protein
MRQGKREARRRMGLDTALAKSADRELFRARDSSGRQISRVPAARLLPRPPWLSSYQRQRQAADDLMDPFREEFDLMSALCARRLRLGLLQAERVRVRVVNQYRTDAERRTILPDLAYGGEAWAVLRLTVPRSVVETGGEGDVHLLTASLAYTDLDGHPDRSKPVHLRLSRLPAAAFAAIAANELVAHRSTELRAAALQEEGREAALCGDWHRVQELLRELRELAESNPWLRASVEKLEDYARRRETQSFSKEAL